MWSMVTTNSRGTKRAATSDDEDNVSGSWSVVSSESDVSSYSQKSTTEDFAKRLKLDGEQSSTRANSPTDSVASTSWSNGTSNFDNIKLDEQKLGGEEDEMGSANTTRVGSTAGSAQDLTADWKAVYQSVFPHNKDHLLVCKGHNSFEFEYNAETLADPNVWKSAYDMMKRGVHVFNENPPVDAPEIICFGTLELAVQFLKQGPEGFEKLIFVHEGLHTISRTVVVPPNFQIVGACNHVCLHGSQETVLEFSEGSSYLGHLNVQFRPEHKGPYKTTDDTYAVRITGKEVKPIFEGCAFLSRHRALQAILVTNKAQPTMKDCIMKFCPAGGLLFKKRATGSFSKCTFRNCGTGAGVLLCQLSNPTFEHCVWQNNKGNGITIVNAKGTFTKCRILSCEKIGIEVMQLANPTVQSSVIWNCGYGIDAHDDARGTFVDNNVYYCEKAAIRVTTHAKPVVRECRLLNNRGAGITFENEGGGLIEGCFFRRTREAAFKISTGSDPTILKNQVTAGYAEGMIISDGGKGKIEENLIQESPQPGIIVTKHSTPVITGNTIERGQKPGVLYNEYGHGVLSNNKICRHTGSAVYIRNGSCPLVKDNEMRKNRRGLRVYTTGGGQVTGNLIAESYVVGANVLPDTAYNMERYGSTPRCDISHNKITDNRLGVLLGRVQLDHRMHHNAVVENRGRGARADDESDLADLVEKNDVSDNETDRRDAIVVDKIHLW